MVIFWLNFNALRIIIALSQGPWIIYGQYLTVQPWTKFLNLKKSYLSIVLAWIRMLGLSRFMYKRPILQEVEGLVGKVVKLNLNTYSKTRGCFARMVVFVDLDKTSSLPSYGEWRIAKD